MLVKFNIVVVVYGVGCIDIVENCFVGMKLCGCYEILGGIVLFKVYKVLEIMVFDKVVFKYCE